MQPYIVKLLYRFMIGFCVMLIAGFENWGGISMPASEAQKQASKKWNQEKVDSLHLRLKKGMRDIIQQHAAKQNESVNVFVARAIQETMERDNAEQ